LHLAVECECKEGVRTLLDLGASLTQGGFEGKNVLEAALTFNATEMVRLLKEYGATYPKKIHYAVMDRNIPLIDEILSASPDLVDGEKDLPKPLVEAVQRGFIDIVKHLIEHGADLEVTNGYGENLLQLATEHGHLEIVELLVELKANLITPNEKEIRYSEDDPGKASLFGLVSLASMKDDPSLFIAVRKGYVDILKFLLEKRFSVDSRLRDGRNLCTVAVQYNQPDALEFLLMQGADPTVKDRWKKSAIDYAL
ncbi:MAG: ankyrin repeat domain-containing protein, partial [Candidatus Omnitrophica bacterium]|nr:ankyrin repeat domain-containing protein [Candidatus Omnitrophota bacterium]